MSIRRFSFALALLLPGVAYAHDHRMDLDGGGSFTRGSVRLGVHGAAAVSLKADDFSWLIDASAHWADLGSDNDTRKRPRLFYTTGVRWAVDVHDGKQRWVPFVQVLVGGVQTTQAGTERNHVGIGFGGGLAYRGGDDPNDGLGIRLQADVFVIDGARSAPRVSVGIVKSFKKSDGK